MPVGDGLPHRDAGPQLRGAHVRYGGAAEARRPGGDARADDGVVDDAREAVVQVDRPAGLRGGVREREGGEGVFVEGCPGCKEV